MASSKIPMGIVLVLVITMLTTRAMGQSGCTNVLIGMASCLNYVTGSSTTPSSSCCSSLASVVKSQPQCLCTALSGGGSVLGININQTLALALPAACKVQTPPVSRCSGGNGPALSPVSSPETSPVDSSDEAPDSPGASPMPGGGSKTVPGNGATVPGNGATVPGNGATSNGSTIKMSLQLIAVLLCMASYASTYSSSL